MNYKIYVVITEKPNKKDLNFEKLKLIKIFNGLTEYKNVKGYWINDKGLIEFDKVLIWEILTINENNGLINGEISQIRHIAENIKTITKQKSQLITINEKPIFI